jgi:hypothetical protein
MHDEPVTLEELIERLRQIQAGTTAAIESLESDRQEIERNLAKLEGPTAALEYVDFFAGFFTHVAEECGRIADELPSGVRRASVGVLRQMASNSAAEQRRCLQYRDKWINKPLAYEAMRPLLNTISLVTRDQLVAFRALGDVAVALDTFTASHESRDEGKTLDRRALLTRLFKPPEDGQ